MATPPPSSTPKSGARFVLLVLGLALAALALSLIFHSPRLWIFAEPHPGSTYWDRGLQFIQQCEKPIGHPLADPALMWRIAPVLLAKLIGLHGFAVFLIPWSGLLVLLSLCAGLVLRRTGDIWIAALVTAVVGTTSATLTVTGWLGINDAWYASALLALAFVRPWPVVTLAAVIGPWIDERFLFALPLALYVRSRALGSDWRPRSTLSVAAAGVVLYAVIRCFNLLHLPTEGVDHLLRYTIKHFHAWLPWSGLGWFMGLRAAWVLVFVAVGGLWRREDRHSAWWPAALALAPLIVITALASDTGRAPTMLLPLVLLGAERLIALHGLAIARRALVFILLANLVMPAMHVTYKTGDIINMLPIEIARCFGQP